jgi:rSAM/selenodomain-associated transferase 1
MNDTVLCIFTKSPIPGQVKTRLIPALGKEDACKLYEELVVNTLKLATTIGFTEVRLYCTPSTTHPFFKACADKYDVQLHLQEGDDLGARMDKALTDSLGEFDYALVIGCDCPWMEKKDLQQALTTLSAGEKVVLGPALDGGYYLLGLDSSMPFLFKDMPWGEPSILRETKERLRSAGLSWSELEEHRDLDRPEDLIEYRKLSVFS